MRTKTARAHVVVFPANPDAHRDPLGMSPAASTLPLFCAICHGAMTLQFSGEWLEENLRQMWACPHCYQTNVDGFPHQLAWVTKDRGER